MVRTLRKKRIGELIQHELATLLLRHTEYPVFKQVSLTEVEVAADLAVAKVFYSVFDDLQIAEAQAVLEAQAWLLRKNLAAKLNLRLTPRLHFIYDESVKRGQKLAALIDQAVAADHD